MGNKKRNRLYILSALIIILAFSSCNSTKPLIIDGAKAQELENRINVLAYDNDIDFRGNSPSNIRNGGNIMMDESTLYLIQQMQFNEDSSFYLRSLPITYIGSLTDKSQILNDLNGTIVALIDNRIYYLEDETLLAKTFDVVSFETATIIDMPISSFRIFNDIGYVSTREGNNVYSFEINSSSEPSLIIEDGGAIIGITKEMIYTLSDETQLTVIDGFDRRTGEKKFSLSGGPFEDAQIAGSFVYYKEGNTLMKKLLDDSCECVSASVLEAKEYAILGEKLIISAPDSGLYISHLDGSHITLLSEDKAKDIQLFDDYLFYRNEYDYDSWYVIQFSTESRFSLLNETITDGGIKFVKANPSLSDSYSAFYEFFINSVQDSTSNKTIIQQKLGPHILIVDTRGEEYTYYTHVDYPFAPQDCDGIIVITNKDTVLGQYTDKKIAYRKDTVLTLFALGDESPVMSNTIEGYPPIDIKSGEGDRYGLPRSWHQRALYIIEKST